MTTTGFPRGLAFVWRPGFDTPDDGYHVTPGDAGGGTFGGVIEATWSGAVARKLVSPVPLRNATREMLAIVLRDEFWGAACDALPAGLDFLLFNGRMMSGGYAALFQRAVGVAQDGDIGPATVKAACQQPAATIARNLTVGHIIYLSRLGASWDEFDGGWLGRILDAYTTALGMLP